jgi:Cytochrome C oxidase, cbb3-type, subunit III
MRFNLKNIALGVSVTVFSVAGLSSCHDNNKTGWEFSPNMYNSRAYEPLTQWRTNTINADGKNMREPVAGTVAWQGYKKQFDSSKVDLMIYNIPKDSISIAEKVLHNPVELDDDVLAEGKVLYERNCQHCHGEKGKGDGAVGAVYKGVPSYSADAYKTMNDGHIFHVITNGKGRMWSHKSQITPQERWKIVHFVHTLQEG